MEQLGVVIGSNSNEILRNPWKPNSKDTFCIFVLSFLFETVTNTARYEQHCKVRVVVHSTSSQYCTQYKSVLNIAPLVLLVRCMLLLLNSAPLVLRGQSPVYQVGNKL